MTIQEIKKYLKENFFLVFKYHSDFYSLRKRYCLFGYKYFLVATDAPTYSCNSLEDLCTFAHLKDGKLLKEAINQIVVPDSSDLSWESFEAVKHLAIVYKHEIHFSFHEKYYWISFATDGKSYLSDEFGNSQMFSSCQSLFDDARIDGRTLEDIWKEVIVDTC